MEQISRSTIERLPLYKKTMEDLLNAGQTHVSSEEIAEELHLSDAQIRKDLSYFGKFGVRGKGYNIESLIEEITEILGTSETCTCILIGVGNLGRALLSYGGFQQHNFKISVAFDVAQDKVGTKINGVEILHMNNIQNYLKNRPIDMAILAVPAENGPDVLTKLIENGIRGILNFAPFVPEVPDYVMVESVDLSTNLEVLAYFMNNDTESTSLD